MNKLLIFALFSATLFVITQGEGQAEEKNVAEVEASLIRDTREADPKKNKDKKEKKQKRKGKNRLGRKKKGKKSANKE